MGAGGVQPASQQSPDYPMALSKIQVMSKEELDELLNDDERWKQQHMPRQGKFA